jgi:hypothetical protein
VQARRKYTVTQDVPAELDTHHTSRKYLDEYFIAHFILGNIEIVARHYNDLDWTWAMPEFRCRAYAALACAALVKAAAPPSLLSIGAIH